MDKEQAARLGLTYTAFLASGAPGAPTLVPSTLPPELKCAINAQLQMLIEDWFSDQKS